MVKVDLSAVTLGWKVGGCFCGGVMMIENNGGK
jgi:hypothetical protein